MGQGRARPTQANCGRRLSAVKRLQNRPARPAESIQILTLTAARPRLIQLPVLFCELGLARQLFSFMRGPPMNSADFQANTPYARLGTLVVDAPAEARTSFIRRTYVHLMAAIYGLVALEFLYFTALGPQLDNWVPNLFSHAMGLARLVRRVHCRQQDC